MIKATDLMVGDYVTFADCIDNPPLISIKIVALSFQDGGDEKSSLVSINNDKACDIIDIDEDIVGIPLTPEILEKNGFKIAHGPAYKDDKFPTYVLFVDGKRNATVVTLSLYEKPIHGVKILTKIECDSSHEGGINMLHSCDIESVHELQRALRCCGLYGLANSFAV